MLAFCKIVILQGVFVCVELIVANVVWQRQELIGLNPKSALKNAEFVYIMALPICVFPWIAIRVILTVRKYVCNNSMRMFSKYVVCVLVVYTIAVFGETWKGIITYNNNNEKEH